MARAGISRERFAALIARLESDDYETHWLGEMLRAAGYVKVAQRDGDRFLATVRQLARNLTVALRTLRNWGRQGLPVFRSGVGNQPALYDVFAVCRWWVERERERRSAEDEEAQAAAGGEKSFWLEEMRKERALQLRRENKVRDGILVDKAKIMGDVSMGMGILRGRLEAIGRRHGPEVSREIAEAVTDAETEFARLDDARQPSGDEKEDET